MFPHVTVPKNGIKQTVQKMKTQSRIPEYPLKGKQSAPNKKMSWREWLVHWDNSTEHYQLVGLLRIGLVTKIETDSCDVLNEAREDAERLIFYLNVADGYLETEPSSGNLKTLAMSMLIRKFFTFPVAHNNSAARILTDTKILLNNYSVIEKLFDFFGQVLQKPQIKNFDPDTQHLGPGDKKALVVFLEEFCRNFWSCHHTEDNLQPLVGRQGVDNPLPAKIAQHVIPILHAVDKIDILQNVFAYPLSGGEAGSLEVLKNFLSLEGKEFLQACFTDEEDQDPIVGSKWYRHFLIIKSYKDYCESRP